MVKGFFNAVNQKITRFVIYPGDDKETLLRKKIWLFMMACYVLFFSFDDLFSFSAGDIQFAIIDAVGIFLAIIVFILYCFHKRDIDKFGLFLQITVIVFPSIKCYLLGGIFHAAGIEIIGLIGPIYALTFPYYRRAIFIFLFYLVMAIGGTFLREYTDPQSEIFNSTFFYLMLVRFTGSVSLMFIISLVYNLQIAKLKMQEEERLKQLHMAKSKFYTNITHEFRTPLTIILGIADVIKEKIIDTVNKEVQMIKNNGGKLLRLVNQLLNLSKMEAGAMSVNMIQSDILPYLKYIVESFHSMAEEKNIQIHFLSSLDSMIMDYDPDIIEEIVSNLLSNALKFTSTSGNVYIQVDTKITDKRESDNPLYIKIRDTGSGIAEDKLPHIFDRFYQADDESTRKSEGTGIGLSLVKEYINLIQGTIQVKSKPGKGTEFILLLPVTHIAILQKVPYKDSKKKYGTILDKVERIDLVKTQRIGEGSNGLPLLLIVEDNDDVIEYLLSILNHEYHAIMARNGNEGIYKAMESVPDAIICDIMMPEKDGYEVCRVLKNDFRTNHIPIVLLTAKADIDSKIEGLDCGADAYIIKPFNKRELLVQLEKLIENRQKLKDKYSEMIYAGSKAGKPKGLNEIFLQKITEALEKNYHDEQYGIFKLCLDVGISRAQLHRKLIALTGKTTSNLIRQYRLKKAKELLLTTDLTISEIAYQVGFKDPHYFTKMFTKEYRVTPSHFRLKNLTVKQ